MWLGIFEKLTGGGWDAGLCQAFAWAGRFVFLLPSATVGFRRFPSASVLGRAGVTRFCLGGDVGDF